MNEKTVAELLDSLFKTHTHGNGREFTYVEVTEALNGKVDVSHLSKLRHGQIKNPGRETLLALCQFFKVPSSYFFPELESPPSAEDIELASVVIHAKNISPKVKRKLQELIEAMEEESRD